MITLEICAQSYQAAMNAEKGGAHRIELCKELSVGGLTPNEKLIHQVCSAIHIPVFVLIRHRGGNFIYDSFEVTTIINEISRSIDAGASGIVCGALTDKNEIDRSALEKMMHACQGLPFTFHRAFEEVKESYTSLDVLIEHGVNRVLTGGSHGNAYLSRTELGKLSGYANGRISILAGSGVTSDNVVSIIKEANVTEVHASAKYGKVADSFNDPNDTNPVEVQRLIHAIKNQS